MNARFEQRSAQWVVFAVLSAFLAGIEFQPDAARSATLMSQEQATQVVSLRNLTVKDGVVSGELVNKSPRTIRDVQLLIRYTWLWNNEMHPGEQSPGDAVYSTVEGDVPSGGSKPFTYRPQSPLPERPDGHFEVSASVAGFTEIIPQK
ncbi:MAG TPA: hypothetical protein VGL70_20055 [Candidatus Binatia bacterium]|jgi:hypothetical protein